MKKYLLMLLVLFSVNAFGWKIIELKDDFGDFTGELKITHHAQENIEGQLMIKKGDIEGEYRFIFFNYGFPQTPPAVKIKIDRNKPIIISRCKNIEIYEDDHAIETIFDSGIIEGLKEGKVLKVSITESSKSNILLKFDMAGLEKILEKLDNQKIVEY